MIGHRTKALAASFVLASATIIATPVAGAAQAAVAPAASKWTGSTSMMVNKAVSRQFLRRGIAIFGHSPAGGTLITAEKMAFSLPVRSVGDVNGSPRVTHSGGLTFTVGDGATQRSVVLKDLTVDIATDKITATVLLEEASADGGSRESLDTITVFTMKLRPQGPSSFPYTLFIGKDLASAASGHLGWFPKAGSRLGSGFTDLIPPS